MDILFKGKHKYDKGKKSSRMLRKKMKNRIFKKRQKTIQMTKIVLGESNSQNSNLQKHCELIRMSDT